MPDGIVHANSGPGGVTSAIYVDKAGQPHALTEQLKSFKEAFVYTVWTIDGDAAYRYTNTLDRKRALSTAKSINGVITCDPLVADFRQNTQEPCDTCSSTAGGCAECRTD